MSTVSKDIADKIVAGNGWIDNQHEEVTPADDQRVAAIICYNNSFGGVSYGLVTHGQFNKYQATEYVRSPRVYWECTDTDCWYYDKRSDGGIGYKQVNALPNLPE